MGVKYERVLFLGYYFIPFDYYKVVYGGIGLGDHDCESTSFWLIFGARCKVICVKRVYFGIP